MDGGEVPGTIERIELENFMCHKKLCIDLSPRVNFIVGENGSGKSAILVALAICFGGKAQFTSRGRRAADVIRHGANSCRVSVTLCNRGDGALDRSVYGDSVVIERRIMRDGGGGYRVIGQKAGERGRVIGHRASDVSDVLDHFNIPVDNPCILLMQDTSKTFLTATRGEDKYKFFLEATQLEMIKESYVKSDELCRRAGRERDQKREQIPRMSKEVKDLREEVENAAGVQELSREIEELLSEEKWAKVRDQTGKVRNTSNMVAGVEEQLNAMSEDVVEKRIHDVQSEIDFVNQEITTLRDKVLTIDKKRALEKEKLKIAQKAESESKAEIDDAKKQKEKTEKRIEIVEKSIQESRNHDERITELARLQKEEKINAAETELNAALKEEERIHGELAPLENEALKMQQTLQSREDELMRIRRDIKRQEDDKQQLLLQKRDALTIYNASMPALKKEVSETTFEHEVIGPIGEYIKLNDPHWNHAIENCVKKATLASFIVRSERDKRRLQSISRHIGFNVQVFVYSISYPREKYPVTKQRYQTMLDVLTIDNPIVYNILVDHCNVELVGVARDRREGKELMQMGARHIYLQNGSMMNKSGHTEAYFPYRIPSRSIYGGRNIDDALKEADSYINQFKVELAGKEETLKELNRDFADIKNRSQQLQRELRDAERNTRQAQSKKKEAETISIKEPQDLEELEANLQAVIETRDKDEAAVQAAIAKNNELKEKTERQKAACREISNELTHIEEQLGTKKSELMEKRKVVESLQQEKDNIEGKRVELKAQLQQLNEQLLEDQQTLASLRADADPFKMVETQRSVETIVKERERKERKQREINKANIDYDEVEREYNRKKVQLTNAEDQLESLESLIEQLSGELNKRKMKYKELLKATSAKTLKYFDIYVKKKPNCSGKIRLDHNKRVLDIEISIDHSKGRKAGTLSGGERSFSTVCLLLSLWNVVDCPFRAMDEFDVYMDSVSRKVAIDTLMETTQSVNRRQYIFITPHNLDGVESSGDVKVFLIQRPERGAGGDGQ